MYKSVLLFAFCCLVISSSYSQQFSIKEIVKVNKAKGVNITYPIFTYKNQYVSAKVNQKIKDIFYNYGSAASGEQLKTAIDKAIDAGMTYLSSHISCYNPNVLCIQLHYEGFGAYPSSLAEYYNFSGYGNLLTLDSIIVQSRMKDFRDLLKKKQAKNISDAMIDLQERLQVKEIDTSDYNWLKDEMKGDCMEKYDSAKFYISNTGLVVIIDCEFPHVVQSMNPNSEIFFSIAELKGIITSDKYFRVHKSLLKK